MVITCDDARLLLVGYSHSDRSVPSKSEFPIVVMPGYSLIQTVCVLAETPGMHVTHLLIKVGTASFRCVYT